MKTHYVCVNCNSEEVQAKAWVSLNDNTDIDFSLSESGDEEDYWCNNCQSHTTCKIEEKMIPINIKIIANVDSLTLAEIYELLNLHSLKTDKTEKDNVVFKNKLFTIEVDINLEIVYKITEINSSFDK